MLHKLGIINERAQLGHCVEQGSDGFAICSDDLEGLCGLALDRLSKRGQPVERCIDRAKLEGSKNPSILAMRTAQTVLSVRDAGPLG